MIVTLWHSTGPERPLPGIRAWTVAVSSKSTMSRPFANTLFMISELKSACIFFYNDWLSLISIHKQNNGIHMHWTQLEMVLMIRMVIQGIFILFIYFICIIKLTFILRSKWASYAHYIFLLHVCILFCFLHPETLNIFESVLEMLAHGLNEWFSNRGHGLTRKKDEVKMRWIKMFVVFFRETEQTSVFSFFWADIYLTKLFNL